MEKSKREYKLSWVFPFTTSVYWYTVYGGCSYGYDEGRAPSVQRVAAEPPPLTHHSTHLGDREKTNDGMIWILIQALTGSWTAKAKNIKISRNQFHHMITGFVRKLINDQCSVNGNCYTVYNFPAQNLDALLKWDPSLHGLGVEKAHTLK